LICVSRLASPQLSLWANAAVAGAATANVIPVSKCARDQVSAALAGSGSSEVRRAIEANSALLQAVEAKGFTAADVLGATTNGGAVTVYIAGGTSTGTDTGAQDQGSSSSSGENGDSGNGSGGDNGNGNGSNGGAGNGGGGLGASGTTGENQTGNGGNG